MSVMGDDLKSSLSASLSKLSQTPNDTVAETEPPSEQRTTSSEGDLNLKPGEVLFEEGKLGDAAYLIVEGTIQISRLHNGKSVSLATVQRGEIIGEMSLIDHQPRMASAVAVEACKLVRISDKNLKERMSKLAENDQVLHFLIKTLVRRLRGLARNTE
jgi:CRP-like cAMP-binding protein